MVFFTNRKAFFMRKPIAIVIAIIIMAAGWLLYHPLYMSGLPEIQRVEVEKGKLADALATPYPAPPITGITGWLNGTQVTMEQLKGKVVLVDFWTYSCINCLRTFKHVNKWYDKYKDQGFEIIGIHAPEFAFEKKQENVEKAIKRYGLKYPVALDNDMATWKSFNNKYWPAHYLIDREGRVVYTHFGEGKYDVTEHNISVLLGQGVPDVAPHAEVTTAAQTPETYLGFGRAAKEWMGKPDMLPLHHWQATGKWSKAPEYIESGGAGDTLTLHFAAKKVFLVLTPTQGPVEIDVAVTGAQNSRMTVDEARLYTLAELPAFTEGTLTLTAQGAGLQAYAFTFESGGD
jgi:thiol-disulfide isomerase/thioredoxin